MIVVVMGVAGAGKTTVGKLLADSVRAEFYDADDFHSPEAIAKMKAGIPLDDADRAPWLARLAAQIRGVDASGGSAVLACSALKKSYREELRAAAIQGGMTFIYLRIRPEVAAARLRARTEHYMHANLVESQFEALEEPKDTIELDGELAPKVLVEKIRDALQLEDERPHA
jgi:gluconokinase